MRMAFLMIGQLLAGQSQHAGDLFRRGRAAQFLGQPRARPPPLRQQLDHVGGNADRLGRVDQRPLDRLLDPVAGVGGEAGADRRVEALDRPEQAEVAFLDQVLQAQALAGIAAGDVDHQPQIGADHAVAGLGVAGADGHGQLVLVVGREQRGLVDLAEIGLQGRLHQGGLAAACLGHRHLHCQQGLSSGTDRLSARRAGFCKEADARRTRGTVAEFRTVAKRTTPPVVTGGGVGYLATIVTGRPDFHGAGGLSRYRRPCLVVGVFGRRSVAGARRLLGPPALRGAGSAGPSRRRRRP